MTLPDSNPDKRPDTAADIVRKAIEQAGWAVEYWYGREKADAYVREALAALDTLVAE